MIQEYNNISAMYAEAAETIKTAILQGQYEALKGENRIQLALVLVNMFRKTHEKGNGVQERLIV